MAVESKYIYKGLEFPNIGYKGRKCGFRKTTTPETRDNGMKGDDKAEPHSAYKLTVSSTIEFSTYRPPSTTLIAAPSHPAPLSKPRFASIGGLGLQISTLKTLLRTSLYNSHHYTNVGGMQNMTFIREPYKYLDRTDHKDADRLDIDTEAIRQWTETYR